MHVATEYPRGAWVDCDDLNDGWIKMAINYQRSALLEEGYKTLGKRFADTAPS